MGIATSMNNPNATSINFVDRSSLLFKGDKINLSDKTEQNLCGEIFRHDIANNAACNLMKKRNQVNLANSSKSSKKKSGKKKNKKTKRNANKEPAPFYKRSEMLALLRSMEELKEFNDSVMLIVMDYGYESKYEFHMRYVSAHYNEKAAYTRIRYGVCIFEIVDSMCYITNMLTKKIISRKEIQFIADDLKNGKSLGVLSFMIMNKILYIEYIPCDCHDVYTMSVRYDTKTNTVNFTMVKLSVPLKNDEHKILTDLTENKINSAIKELRSKFRSQIRKKKSKLRSKLMKKLRLQFVFPGECSFSDNDQIQAVFFIGFDFTRPYVAVYDIQRDIIISHYALNVRGTYQNCSNIKVSINPVIEISEKYVYITGYDSNCNHDVLIYKKRVV